MNSEEKRRKAHELKEEANRLDLEASQEECQAEIKAKEKYRLKTKTDVYCSDDYAHLGRSAA